MATDPRAKWFTARLTEGFSLDPEHAPEIIEAADCAKVFLDFFSATGPQKVLFFYDGDKLRYTTDDEVAYPGRIMFFVRPTLRNVPIANAETEFTWACTGAETLPSLQALLSEVYIPLLERSPTWGKLTSRTVIDAYLTQLRKYICALKEAQCVLNDRYDFRVPTDKALLTLPVDPTQIQKTISDNPDLVGSAERALAEVSNQIELFLAESTRVRVDDDASGPETEVVYWRARMASFNAVHQKVHGIPWLQSCVTLLQNTQSSVVQRWVRIKQRVLEGVAEAKDNLKYLYTLEEVLDPIYRAEPAKISEAVPHLMDTVKNVYQMARYYSTTENMTTLLVKISNQMIRACRDYLRTEPDSPLIPRPGLIIPEQRPETAPADDDEDPAAEVIASLNKKRPSPDELENMPTIYDRLPEDILQKIDECIQLSRRYQKEYHRVKAEMRQEGCEKQFNFSESGIFGNFELFCTRLKKIAEIIITNENFSSLQRSTLQNLQSILDQSDKLIGTLRKKSYDPVNHRLTQFDADHAVYMEGIGKLEESINAYVAAACSDEDNTVNDIILILRQLHIILNRPALRDVIMSRYEFLLNRYVDEIVKVKAYFDENRDEPPIPLGWSPVAGRLAWVRLIMRRLSIAYEFFRRVQIHIEDENDPAIQRSASFENLLQATTHIDEYLPLLSYYKSGRRAYKMYMKLVKQLFDYESAHHDAWVESISSLRASLQATLLVEHPQTGKLYVNFDRKLALLCREVHYLRQLRVEIPEAALAITMHERSLLHYRDTLHDLLGAIDEIKASINPAVADLMKPLLARLNKKVSPGLTTLCWTSMSIGGYLDSIRAQVKDVRETIKTVDDILALRISTNLRAISTTCLLPLLKRTAFGSADDPSEGGTVTLNNAPHSRPEDDTEENAPYTSHKMRLFSAYLEQNTGAMPYKQYLELARPHIRQATESIYGRSQLVAIAVIDIVIAITSRYVHSPDSEHAAMLSEIVTGAIQSCFSPAEPLGRQLSRSSSSVGLMSGQGLTESDEHHGGGTQEALPPAGVDAATVIRSAVRAFVERFHESTITAVFLCTERTLRALYQRITMYLDPYQSPTMDKLHSYYVPDALVLCDFELALPTTRISPAWEEMRKGAVELVSMVMQVSKRLPRWNASGDYMGNVLTTIRPIITRQSPEFIATQLAQTINTTTLGLTGETHAPIGDSSTSARAAFEKSASRSSSRVGTARGGTAVPSSSRGASGSDSKGIFDRAEALPQAESFYGMLGRSRTLLKLLVALKGAFNSIVKRVDAYLGVFDSFKSLWLDDKAEAYKKFIDRRPALSDFLVEIVRYEDLMQNVRLIPTMVQQGTCVFSTEALKNSLLSEASVWKSLFASNLNARARLELSTMKNYVGELQATVGKKIGDLDDVRQIMIALSKLRELEAVFDLKIQPIDEMYERLESHGIKITAEEAEDLSDLRNNLRKLQDSAIRKQDELKDRAPTLKQELCDGIQKFKERVKAFHEDWDENGPNAMVMKDGVAVQKYSPQQAVQQLKTFQAQFNDIEQKWITYQSGEETFGLEVTMYPELTTIKKDLKMLNSLYGLYTDVLSTIDGYSDQLWSELNFDDIQILISDYQQRCLRLPKAMRDWQAYIDLQKKIDDFNTLLPLFQLMSHPAVKERHWIEISKVTKDPSLTRVVEDPDNFKLKDLLAANPLAYNEDLEEICSAATKETEIEEKLGQVRAQWQEQNFTFQEFKARGLLNLAPSETSELIVMLEDSQMLLSSLVSNRFNKPFKEELSQWVKRLSTLDEILILWLQVQQSWIYLEAVFSGGDISRQLPAEAKRFSQIDKSWVKIMTTAVTTPNCIHLTSVDDTLKSLLPYLIEQLELCQKSLSGYLEQKRNLFARFYFVSDPVLLEILGQQSDPSSIQPHLLSIFDSIYMLDFDRVKRNNVVAMNDRSGEKVQLSTIVEAKGSVEDWLNDLIKVMQRSLKDIIRNAAADLTKPDVSVQEIFETYPAQVTLLCIQMMWTIWIESGLRQVRTDKKIMQATLKRVNALLQTLVSITLQDLNKRQRTNVETLVTIHVHQRDVSEELTNAKIKSPTDFEWLKQTRFYWSTDTDNCKIQITDIDFTYQNEYLGVNERLVITPLTDRCYITLAQAIGMYLGGAPAGPAGTGKTETVKDLGKTLGMYVVVFNCSDQMDYKGLGKIYRGIAQTGCYGDFDEFNRIDLSVLSVSAQQIQCVLSAVKERKKTFLYTDGCVISLIPSCGIFITMNPGYAGRQELPENLKALFRSVAMMVPDREIIIRVKLASAGFMKSSVLAKKFFILYQLCEEQLSKQRHYDFGLRNILSVLRTCGARRRSNPDLSEDNIMLRVLTDMNRSKLVDDDTPLFMSLTEDLFPGLKVEDNTYPELDSVLATVCGELYLQLHPEWLKAVVQFYETHLVRHGIMLLGPPLSGKSQSILSLAKAMSAINAASTTSATPAGMSRKYTVIKMNPKAITAPQMFGRLDAATGDWTDGIFSSIWRRCSKREGEWFFFCLNGPVDAVWIENLNTVLDDNKTLTLANSDRIPMSQTLKLVFEIDSLANASPATVSRAGMIYMSASILGWQPVLASWVAQWSDASKAVLTAVLSEGKVMDELYLQLDTAALHPVTVVPRLQLFRSFLMVLTSMVYFGSGDKPPANENDLIEVGESISNALSTASHITSEGFTNATQAQQQAIATNAGAFTGRYTDSHFRKMISFALMWSFGAVLELEEKVGVFQKFLYDRAAVLDLPKLDPSNPADTVYNYFVDDTGEWRSWASVVPTYDYSQRGDTPFASILIPTIDNTSINSLLTKLNYTQFNVMLIGESGSGKTVDVLTFLADQDKEKYAVRNINFSSATTTHLLQDNIEAFVEKRMGLSYGPAAGKRGMVFIDEINIPLINEWGDQPTNELTRQLIEERGFYALDKPGEFHIMQDLTFIAAAPLPGGGRNDIPTRLKGHFVTINVNLPASDQLDMIFGTIVRGHYHPAPEGSVDGFSEDVCGIAAKLVMTTRKLWQATKARMLPTPAKFHYVFNLRDLSRITQGFINSQPDVIDSARKLVYLWANECTRVLPDKFTTLEDVAWFNNAIVQFAAEDLGDALAAEVEAFAAQNNIITVPQFARDEEGNERRIYFVDFMRDPPEDVPDDADDAAYEAPKIYEPVFDKELLLERIRNFQGKYNELNRRSPLDLVFFDACVAHILRISRVIRTPRGHCLLVGVGGSGKQSCTKLASSIAGYTTFQITITRGYNISNFDDDLRALYRVAGVDNKGVVFLFTDSDVKDEVFLERINNILTSGEVPALFGRDDVENITNDCRPGFKKERPREPDTNENIWNFFLNRVKTNLHVVLCFSPVGPKFRERARKFPGLISGCTTDWFQPWPRQALCEVAHKSLGDYELRTKEGDGDVRARFVDHIAQVHLSMTDVTTSYFERFRRQTYVTPKSYLSFLGSFKELYKEKLRDLKDQHSRLKTGLDKLETAASDVNKMRGDLEIKEKDLAVAQAKASEMMKVISVSTAEAEATKKQVQAVADELKVQADEIAAQKAEAEEGLAKALPALEKAEKALQAIEPGDINTLKKLAKPPHLIQRIMDSVLILMNMPIDKVTPDPDFPPDKKILRPSWKNSLLLMNQAGFLKSLLDFERDGITDETCELLEAYLEMGDFNVEAARKSSGNVAGLLQWSQAMYEYHFIALEVEPKRAAVREAEASFRQAMASLKEAQDDLAEKQAALDKLQAQYDEAVNEKKRLQDEADLTGKRLHAASALINGLSGERKRWSQQARELDDAAVRLLGDASLSSAFLSYAGPFNQEYRQHLVMNVWLKDLEERKLPFTRGIESEIHNFLVAEATVGEWRLQGLPTDQLSTENGIIVTTSTRYPLMIDPQTQAATWIKNMYPDLKVTTLTNKYFRQMVEDALNMGQPLLIEDVEEELDPLLDPVLEKQFVKSGKSLKVKLGDKECDVCDGFKLFITSKLPNPRYSPETYAKTSIIDFSVTFSGLEAQLLARTVNIERRELEDQRRELLEEVNANKKQMAQLEEDLLTRLSETKGNLLDDSELVEVLNRTKATTEEVKEKLASAVETERKINDAREEFLVVATRGSIIYFLVTEMSAVNSMYQTSLRQFLELFDQAIQTAEPSPITTKRITNVIQNMTSRIFRYIARGLYERDKLLFILQLCLKIDLKAGNVSSQEFGTFIRGGAALDLSSVRAKPAPWIPDKAWLNVIALSSLNTFASLPNQIAENEHVWRAWYDAEAPENIDLPPEYNNRINVFQKLLLVRCLREDRTMLAVNEYIIHSLGPEFAEPVPVNFEDIFVNEAKQHVPVTFLLSLGSDPTSQIEVVAKKLKIEMRFISMGQGQEPQARRLITEGIATGTWVMISNSHLGLKFMAEIELMIIDLTERMALAHDIEAKDAGDVSAAPDGGDKVGEGENLGTGGIFGMLARNQLPHENFRLILTTDPHPQFPIGLLQKTIKLTNDPASGCRASLKRTYQTLTQDYLETCDKPQWLPLVFCIAFIHTTLIERKKFGSLGWCIPYEFSLPDFTSSVQFLQNYLYGLDTGAGGKGKGMVISYSTIRYMIGEVHYGGRVTDDFDRRLLKTYCEEWISARSLTPEFEFYRGYHIPKHVNITEARAYIDGLPFVDKPQIYGLHSNADILFRSKQAGEILTTIVNMQPKDSGGGGGGNSKEGGKQQVVLTREEQVLKQTKDILSKLPPDYDIKVTVRQQIQKQGGKAKPLNVFLGQEIDRMQVVLGLIRTTLADLQLAIAGTIIMNEALQDSLDSLYDARVPARWLAVSWPASTLGFWLSDVTSRCTQFTEWLVKGRPLSYWLSGYFNPQGFLTSVKQEITRMHQGWALDRVYPRTTVSKFSDRGQVNQPPEEGVYIHGLFLDAAAWDKKNNRLIDLPPKVLQVPLPLLHVDATNDVYVYPTKTYDCPLYKTPARTGLNYIFTVKLPTDTNPNKWTLRGAALLCNTQ